jgi:hypothetical protein
MATSRNVLIGTMKTKRARNFAPKTITTMASVRCVIHRIRKSNFGIRYLLNTALDGVTVLAVRIDYITRSRE